MIDLPPTVQVWMCEANEGNSDRDIYSRGYGGTDTPSSSVPIWIQQYRSKKTTQAIEQMAIALGWAAAGQADKAVEHGIEALQLQTEAVWDASKEIFDSVKDVFSRD